MWRGITTRTTHRYRWIQIFRKRQDSQPSNNIILYIVCLLSLQSLLAAFVMMSRFFGYPVQYRRRCVMKEATFCVCHFLETLTSHRKWPLIVSQSTRFGMLCTLTSECTHNLFHTCSSEPRNNLMPLSMCETTFWILAAPPLTFIQKPKDASMTRITTAAKATSTTTLAATVVPTNDHKSPRRRPREKARSRAARVALSFVVSSLPVWAIVLQQPESIFDDRANSYYSYSYYNNLDYSLPLLSTQNVSASPVVRSYQEHLNVSTLLAYQQSFGFFDDIPDHAWRRVQQRARTTSRYRNASWPADGYTNPGRWYAHNLPPVLNCFQMERVGGLDDGPKWTCDPHRLQSSSRCLIYSIGSAGQYQWELGLVERLGSHCEIHVFEWVLLLSQCSSWEITKWRATPLPIFRFTLVDAHLLFLFLVCFCTALEITLDKTCPVIYITINGDSRAVTIQIIRHLFTEKGCNLLKC